PVTGLETPFAFSGDPVGGGWLDTTATDKRFLMSSAPGTLGPGGVREVWAAIEMGRGGDRLASTGVVGFVGDLAPEGFETGFPLPLPGPGEPCSTAIAKTLVNCPRPSYYWGSQCAAGGGDELTTAQLTAVADLVDQRSTLFDWGVGALSSFCATVDPGPAPNPRQRARAEYAALMANVAANLVPLTALGDRI